MALEESVSRKLKPGTYVKVYYRIHEGDKARVQPYEGLIIALKGNGVGRTFTVRREGADNIGVERIFPIYSPNLEKVDILSQLRVRRAKLYYTRNLSTKSLKKREKHSV